MFLVLLHNLRLALNSLERWEFWFLTVWLAIWINEITYIKILWWILWIFECNLMWSCVVDLSGCNLMVWGLGWVVDSNILGSLPTRSFPWITQYTILAGRVVYLGFTTQRWSEGPCLFVEVPHHKIEKRKRRRHIIIFCMYFWWTFQLLVFICNFLQLVFFWNSYV